jgi:hypothetical protein
MTAGSFLADWAPVLAPLAVFALLLLVPGALVLVACGFRLLRALALAPVISIALAGLGGVVLQRIGVAWSPASFGVVALVVAVLAGVVRALVTRRPPWSGALAGAAAVRRLIPAIIAGLVVAVAAVVVQYMIPVGGADRFTYNYDAMWHAAVIRHILLTGDASSLDTGLLDGTSGSHYYPAAWHSLVALTMQLTGSSITVAINASIIVLFALVWPLGAGVLAVRIFGRSRLVVLGSVGTAALFAAFPSHYLDFGPLYSNLLSFAIAPVCLAFLLPLLDIARWRRGLRRRTLTEGAVVVVATLVAFVFAQPNSIFTLAVILLPPAYVLVFRLVRGRLPARRWASWTAVAVFTVVWITAWIVVHDSAALHRTVAVDWPAQVSTLRALAGFALQATEFVRPQIELAVLIAIGIVVALRTRGARWVVVSYGLLGILYVLDAGVGGGPGSFRDYATGFWYHDHTRLAAALVLLAAPLVGAGLRGVFSTAGRLLSRRRIPRLVATIAAVVVVAGIATTMLSGLTGAALAVRRDYLHQTTEVDRYQWMNPEKASFLAAVREAVASGSRIANNPYDGSGLAYAFDSMPVVFSTMPGNWIGTATPDQVTVATRLDSLAADQSICSAVHREGIGYVLALAPAPTLQTPRLSAGYSPEFWRGLVIQPDTPGFELVLSRGDMSLYRITGCG